MSLNNVISIGQFAQGAKDLSQGIKSKDAGDAANALAQILVGIKTAAGPLGDFTGVVNLGAAAITAVKIVRDYNDPDKKIDPLDILAVGSNLAALAIAIGKSHPLLLGVSVVLGLSQVIMGSIFLGEANGAISPTVNTATTGALTWVPYSCPLILDLDGGGISNSGIGPIAPIFFDHDGDGVRNASGWVGAGEAIVVRDLNGNGTIDSGREIFGDNTLLTRGPRAGQRAASGFEALADLDSNNDGQFNAADAAFASVKLWKDANQHGISEVGELFTFAQLGVQGIKVSGWVDGTRLTDADGELTGNRQILAGTFTWANGGGGQACTTCACIQ